MTRRFIDTGFFRVTNAGMVEAAKALTNMGLAFTSSKDTSRLFRPREYSINTPALWELNIEYRAFHGLCKAKIRRKRRAKLRKRRKA